MIRLRPAFRIEPVMVRVSMAVNVGVMAMAEFKVATRRSVPAPPVSASLEPSVCKAEEREPSKVSSPLPPVKLFALVVSGQVTTNLKSLI